MTAEFGRWSNRGERHVPSHTSYTRGCRCRGCTEAHRVSKAEYRARVRAGWVRPEPGVPGEVLSQCWCTARYVMITLDELRRGVTRSCPRCPQRAWVAG